MDLAIMNINLCILQTYMKICCYSNWISKSEKHLWKKDIVKGQTETIH